MQTIPPPGQAPPLETRVQRFTNPRGFSFPRCVFFDMDGLLVDSEPAHAAAYVSAFRTYGLRLSLEEYRTHVTLHGGSIRELYQQKGGKPDLWPAVSQLKRTHFEQNMRANMHLLPGVLQLLRALAEHAIPRILVTGSGRFSANLVLEHFDIERYFAAKFCAEDVTHTKPDPEVFLKAAAWVGAAPHQCLSLEDSPKGVRAAAAAGVPCIAVPTEWTKEADFTGAALVVSSLEQLSICVLARVAGGT